MTSKKPMRLHRTFRKRTRIRRLAKRFRNLFGIGDIDGWERHLRGEVDLYDMDLPYFNGMLDRQCGIGPEGRDLTPEEFLDKAESMRVDADFLLLPLPVALKRYGSTINLD
jgi:hypothetical protein